MPRGIGKLGILAIGDGAPAGGKRLFDDVRGIIAVEILGRKNVDGGPQGFIGIEGIGFGGGDVHTDGLGGAKRDTYGKEKASRS